MKERRLVLLRHAKSDWSVPGQADFDRPLSARGRKAAPRMGKWLRRHDLLPDVLVSSPARRARETSGLVAKGLRFPEKHILWDERIYEATSAVLLDVIREHAGAADRILLVGHNPGLDDLLCQLCAVAPPRDAEGKLMTTGAVAVVIFDYPPGFEAGAGRLETLVRPRDLKGTDD